MLPPPAQSYKSGLQHDAISANDNLLAVASSELGGNKWQGQVTVFENDLAGVAGAVAVEAGVSSLAWLDLGATGVLGFVAGGDDGDAHVFRQGESGVWAEASNVGEHDDLCSGVSTHGALLCTSSWDCTLKLWDLRETRSPVRVLAHDARVLAVACMGPDLIAVCVEDNSLWVWDARSPEPVQTKQFEAQPLSLAFASDLYVGFSNGDVVCLRQDQVALVRTHQAKVRALALSSSPADAGVLSGSDDGVVHGLGAVHGDFVRGAAFWTNRRVTASWDGTVKLWD
jgi:WD40 repeat protein